MSAVALSVADACVTTTLSKAHLARAIESGELRSIKVGKRRLILPEDLAAYLASFASEGTSATPTRSLEILDRLAALETALAALTKRVSK